MAEKDKKTESIGAAYLSPQVRVILVKSQHVLCGSFDNEPMGENDISDAFHQD